MNNCDVTGTWRRKALIALLLAATTLAVYWPVGRYDFTNYDDQNYVWNNPVVQKGLSLQGVVWAFTTNLASNWHPLTWLSHMLDCQLFGVNPGAHHLVNVLFHIVNTLLLFLVLNRLTGAVYRSGFVAALFALHPLHVESVAWISERKDVLSAFFWILTMGAYDWYARRPVRSRFLLVLALFVLGLLSKPMMVTLPCVLLLLDFWPLRRIRWKDAASLPASSPDAVSDSGTVGAARPALPLNELIIEKIPMFVLAVISSTLTILAQRNGGAAGSLEVFPIFVRIVNAFVSYAAYLGQMICPEDLAVLYPYREMVPGWMIVGSSILLTGIFVLTWILAWRRPYLLVGWWWFLGTLVPVIGLVQVGMQSMADRYTYLPFIGLFIMFSWGLADFLASRPVPKAAIGGGAALLLGGLMLASSAQVRHWENSITLFTQATNATTNNPVAHYGLAYALSAKGAVDGAILHYSEAVRLNPGYVAARNNLGLALVAVGRIDEATNQYAAALGFEPHNPYTHFNYGLALASLGDYEAAMPHYAAVLQADPNHLWVHNSIGEALVAQNKMPEAIQQFTEAVRVNPNFDEAQMNLGAALAKQGEIVQALSHLTVAVRLNPALVEARAQLGAVLAATHRNREAVAEYREALRLKPDHVQALNGLAWVLATAREAGVRNGREAVQLAERACQLTSDKVPEFLGTLAAAYAEAGKFNDAVQAAQKACALATAIGQTDVASRHRKLLALYQAGQPCRDMD